MLLPKLTHWAVLCPLLSTPFGVIIAQEPAGSTTGQSAPVVTTSPDTYIPGDLTVTPFTPPAPKPPTAPLPDAKETIVVNDTGGHTVILQRGPASMAPDIPSHEETQVETPAPDLTQFPARPATTTLNFSGVVYDQHVSVIHWKHPQSGAEYSAALGYDVNLVGQIGKFIRQGKAYQLFLICTPQSTQGPQAALRAQHGFPPIEVPQVDDESYRLLTGNAADSQGMEPLLAIHEIYLAEKNRLIQYKHDIEEYREQEKAWKEAHPEPEGPTVFWFKPHRNSRYLTETDKLKQAAAAIERSEVQGQGANQQNGEAQ